MSTKPKDEHVVTMLPPRYLSYNLPDFTVKQAFLALINNQHTDTNQLPLFDVVEIYATKSRPATTRFTHQYFEDFNADWRRLIEMPDVPVGKTLYKTVEVSFLILTAGKACPEKSILSIPRLSRDKTNDLLEQGIFYSLEDIPAGVPRLLITQRDVCSIFTLSGIALYQCRRY